MLVQALLVSLWALVCGLDASTWQLGIYSPLVAGSVTGLILGDFTQGLILSSTFQLMFLGIVGIGAYVPPDTITGSMTCPC